MKLVLILDLQRGTVMPLHHKPIYNFVLLYYLL